jgi:hypothetical protein
MSLYDNQLKDTKGCKFRGEYIQGKLLNMLTFENNGTLMTDIC